DHLAHRISQGANSSLVVVNQPDSVDAALSTSIKVIMNIIAQFQLCTMGFTERILRSSIKIQMTPNAAMGKKSLENIFNESIL
ncbi:hypothetical protein JW992_00930, partial [candidate division KSB1 bacterium]|nr:hypothetical protein [candidate division KSB1 bacterium]